MEKLVYTVRELQARIGEAPRLVGAGHRVTVTSRGRVVAEMVPVNGAATEASNPERRALRRMAAQGKVILGTGGPIRLPVFRSPGIVREFLKEREDRLKPRRRGR